MKHLIGKTIQFTSKIEEIEAYAEKGMRARVVSINEKYTHRPDIHDHVYEIKFDYSEFDEFNKNLESSNYYDRNNVACLTAREVGVYEPVEVICFGSPQLYPFEDYFTILNEKQNNLLARFKESGATNYVEWLESQI
jgi:hypothetical protein